MPWIPQDQRWSLADPLRKLWYGKIDLGWAFWGFYILGGFVCLIVASLVGWPFWLLGMRPVGLIATAVVIAGYGTITTVGVWRSAGARSTIWALLARVIVALWAVSVVMMLVNGGAARLILDVMQ